MQGQAQVVPEVVLELGLGLGLGLVSGWTREAAAAAVRHQEYTQHRHRPW